VITDDQLRELGERLARWNLPEIALPTRLALDLVCEVMLHRGRPKQPLPITCANCGGEWRLGETHFCSTARPGDTTAKSGD